MRTALPTFAVLLVMLISSPLLADGRIVNVADDAELKAALADAKPGDTIRLTGKEYHRVYCVGPHGDPRHDVTIESATSQPATFLGAGGTGMQFCQPSYLIIRNIIIRGSTVNGLNIDDGGSITHPAYGIWLDNVQVLDTGPKGNFNGIKLSGVDTFNVIGCTVAGWGGSGIDMVGCHDGLILSCKFRGKAEEGFSEERGIQMKGGSRNLHVKDCSFENGGVRAINIGGVTGLDFFRPPASQADAYEAKDILVETSTFVGSESPIAFVGIDGATVRYNTFYRPGKWIMRILEESPPPRFVPCRNGEFYRNVIAFNKAALNPAVNVGEKTAPETFHFSNNAWYRMDDPAASKPQLPAVEKDGFYGKDPKFEDPANGDFHIHNWALYREAGFEAHSRMKTK